MPSGRDPLTERVSRNASFAFEARWLAGAGIYQHRDQRPKSLSADWVGRFLQQRQRLANTSSYNRLRSRVSQPI